MFSDVCVHWRQVTTPPAWPAKARAKMTPYIVPEVTSVVCAQAQQTGDAAFLPVKKPKL